MELKERVLQTAEQMREIKNQWVASNPKNTDVAIYLQFYRGDELVAVLQTKVDRDTALQAGQVGAAGFAADTMSIAFESYHSSHGTNPVTNKPWRPQEMQFIFQTYPEAAEKGWVTECITITGHERDGGYILYSMPYRLHGTEVEWLEEQAITYNSGDDKDTRGGVVMFEFLQEVMTQPTIAQVLDERAGSDPLIAIARGLVMDDEARIFHTDMATCTALEERGLVENMMISAKPGSVRAELLRERLGNPDSQGQFPVV